MTGWKRLTGEQQAFKLDNPQSEGVTALSFIHDDRVAQLDIRSAIAIAVAFVPSPVNYNPSFTVPSLQQRILVWLFPLTNRERETEKLSKFQPVSFSRIKIHPLSTFWPNKWKMKETNSAECRSIMQSLSPSLYLGSLIKSEWREKGSVQKGKTVGSPGMATIACICLCANSSNYKPLTQVAGRNIQLKMSIWMMFSLLWMLVEEQIDRNRSGSPDSLRQRPKQNPYNLSFVLKRAIMQSVGFGYFK